MPDVASGAGAAAGAVDRRGLDRRGGIGRHRRCRRLGRHRGGCRAGAGIGIDAGRAEQKRHDQRAADQLALVAAFFLFLEVMEAGKAAIVIQDMLLAETAIGARISSDTIGAESLKPLLRRSVIPSPALVNVYGKKT